MRKRTALMILLLICGFLTSCAKETEPDARTKSVVVGFSQLGAESSWRIANTISMEEAAKEAAKETAKETAIEAVKEASEEIIAEAAGGAAEGLRPSALRKRDAGIRRSRASARRTEDLP